MQPVHEMTLAELAAENKALMASEAESKARRAEISAEVGVRQATDKAQQAINALSPEARAKVAARLDLKAGAES